MKSVTAFLYIENPETERIVLESVKNFKSVELLESVSDKFSFLERAGAYCPDLMFIDFSNQVESNLELFDLISKPIFSIAICDDPSHTNKFLDKGFFDVVSGPISKEQLTKKIYKVMKISSDIVQRFRGVSIVASPPPLYSTSKSTSKTLINSVYLKYKNTRVKVP
jgi:response regulator RpfG family c-di-GMP phosphodiesterase